jgi:hypothetical protein
MTIQSHLGEFCGMPIVDFDPDAPPIGFKTNAWRLSVDYESSEAGGTLTGMLASLLAAPDVEQLTALVIGCWEGAWEGTDSSSAVEGLVAARDRLNGLRHLFLGEIVCEESEISWINQSDISPLFSAFPDLESLFVRGANGLSLGRPRHAQLKKLVIESGGLPGAVVREVASADLPKLEHLELWLGEENYGNDVTMTDLEPILSGRLFPKLRYLGLRDDCNADNTAKALATAPILGRLESLDLSLGTLGDEGAEALLASPLARSLKFLDLHHHYLSDRVAALLARLGPRVDLSDQCEPDDWGDGEKHRYVAVGE